MKSHTIIFRRLLAFAMSVLLCAGLLLLLLSGCAGQDPRPVCTCTVSISCQTALDNFDRCKEEKQALLPENGWILQPTEVTCHEGDSAFDVLAQVCREQKIQLESSWTPLYDSAYIEGINNLYEFDVGQGSGWMYQVNGRFPNCACSDYTVQSEDVLCWVYTCDYGEDVGGSAAGD
ncbi:MAG: DUF4430 domain-containing protein [Candidatus Faecousia sp.]|nr:DUF4430 domain-containing protein [Candidatus Faecousia sp.]